MLLIDEIDRADEEFEAFLLELLSDFQITVPEIGTLKAEVPPIVVITSNRTRELHDALKRRCLYHWIDYPSIEKEEQIIAVRQPQAPRALARQISRFMHDLRKVDLYKVPGVAETLDWAAALSRAGAGRPRAGCCGCHPWRDPQAPGGCRVGAEGRGAGTARRQLGRGGRRW